MVIFWLRVVSAVPWVTSWLPLKPPLKPPPALRFFTVIALAMPLPLTVTSKIILKWKISEYFRKTKRSRKQEIKIFNKVISLKTWVDWKQTNHIFYDIIN